MDFLTFFDQDIEIIKSILTEDLLTEEDGGHRILLSYLMKTKNEKTIKYVLEFTQKNLPHILDNSVEIINNLFEENKSLDLIKYVFKLKSVLKMMSERSYVKILFYHEDPETVYYCLKFFQNNFPKMFFKTKNKYLIFEYRPEEDNIFENLFLKNKKEVIRIVYYFFKENFPLLLNGEISLPIYKLFESNL